MWQSSERSLAIDHATAFWSPLIMLSSSCTLFVTSRWTVHLRTWLPGLTGSDVTLIITFLDLGAFMMFVPGYCYDAYGCKAVGYVGAMLTFVGYLSMYAVASIGVDISIWLLCLIAFVIGQGSIWLVSCAKTTMVNNFEKEDQGRAIGLVMTTFGLSAGIFSQIIVLVDGDSGQPSLLVLLGVTIASISAVAVIGTSSLPRGCRLTAAAAGTNEALGICVLMLFLVSMPAFARPKLWGLDLWASLVVALYSLVLLFQVFLAVRLMSRYGPQVLRAAVLRDETGMALQAARTSTAALDGATFKDALKSTEYWLLIFVFLVAVGVGLTMTNSIADIRSIEATAGVAVFAAGNSLGRFVPGYLSDMLVRTCDRIGFIIIATVVLIASQVTMLLGQEEPHLAYAGVFLTAMSFGSYWVLVPAAEAEWFGRLAFGKIHGFLVFVSGDGGVLLIYKYVASIAEARRGPCDLTENSAACFEIKWHVNFVLSCVALLAACAIKVLRRRCEARTVGGTHRSTPCCWSTHPLLESSE